MNLTPGMCRLANGITTPQQLAGRIRNDGATLSLFSTRGAELVTFGIPSAVMRPVAQDCIGSHLRNQRATVVAGGTVSFGQLRGNVVFATFDLNASSPADDTWDGEFQLGDVVELTSFFISWAS
jgi:hypothetical protein